MAYGAILFNHSVEICIVRGKPTLFDGLKIFLISTTADLPKIIKTDAKSYPSYFHTYPRNGKTTVLAKFAKPLALF